MRISDWSSDVCSSDLLGGAAGKRAGIGPGLETGDRQLHQAADAQDAGRVDVALRGAVGRGRALTHVDAAELLAVEEDFDAAVHPALVRRSVGRILIRDVGDVMLDFHLVDSVERDEYTYLGN